MAKHILNFSTARSMIHENTMQRAMRFACDMNINNANDIFV